MARTIKLQGSLKALLQAAAAALLSAEPVLLKNVPEVLGLVEALNYLGVAVESIGRNELLIDALQVTDSVLPETLVRRFAEMELFWGSLLARTGRSALPIRNKPLQDALVHLGVEVRAEREFTVLEGQVKGGTLNLPQKSRLDSLTIVLAAVAGRGLTTLQNAAEDPEIDDTLELLGKMGASAVRTEPGTVVVQGVDLAKLQEVEHELPSDRDQAVREICRALSEGDDVQIEQIEAKYLTAFLSKLAAVGVSYQVHDKMLEVWREPKKPLVRIGLEPKPFPGFEPQWVRPFQQMLKETKAS